MEKIIKLARFLITRDLHLSINHFGNISIFKKDFNYVIYIVYEENKYHFVNENLLKSLNQKDFDNLAFGDLQTILDILNGIEE